MEQPHHIAPTPEPSKITPFPEPPPHLGRPSIRTPEIVSEICAAIRLDGISDSCAGLLAGVSTSTLSRWKQDDEEFAVRLGQARAQFELERVRAIRNACKRDGSVDWRAQAWLLQKSSPETYGPPPRRRKARPEPEEDAPPANGQPVVTPREMELLQAARARSLAGIAEEHKAIRAAVAAGAFSQTVQTFPKLPRQRRARRLRSLRQAKTNRTFPKLPSPHARSPSKSARSSPPRSGPRSKTKPTAACSTTS